MIYVNKIYFSKFVCFYLLVQGSFQIWLGLDCLLLICCLVELQITLVLLVYSCKAVCFCCRARDGWMLCCCFNFAKVGVSMSDRFQNIKDNCDLENWRMSCLLSKLYCTVLRHKTKLRYTNQQMLYFWYGLYPEYRMKWKIEICFSE